MTPHTDFKTRLNLINAYIIGKLNFMLPIYSIADKSNMNKLHKIITTSARTAIGSYCFKKSVKYMLNKCKWLDIRSMIQYSNLSLIHKTLNNKSPKNIYEIFFRKIDRTRVSKNITLKYIPKTEKMNRFFVYKYTKIYNGLDDYVKIMKIKGFKNEIKAQLMYNPVNDSND